MASGTVAGATTLTIQVTTVNASPCNFSLTAIASELRSQCHWTHPVALPMVITKPIRNPHAASATDR